MSQHPLSSVLFLTCLRASILVSGYLTPEPTSALGMVLHHAVSYPTPKNSILQKWIYELLFLSSQLYASAKRPSLNASSEAGILPTVKHKSRLPHVTYSRVATKGDICVHLKVERERERGQGGSCGHSKEASTTKSASSAFLNHMLQ